MRKYILGTGFLTAALIALPLYAAELNQTSNSADDENAASTPAADAPHFTKVIEDLPLMPGLQLVEDEDVLFATPGEGRIAETNAIGPVEITDVYKFYRHSLPHLGWRTVDAHTFVREGEQLRIDAHSNQKITVVRFTVKPTGS